MKLRELFVDAVAGYRLTRLITADSITHEPRDAIVHAAYVAAGRAGRTIDEMHDADIDERVPGEWSKWAEHDDEAPKLAVLVTCRWCTGVWVAAGIALARYIAPRVWQRAAETLTVAAAAALIAGLEE